MSEVAQAPQLRFPEFNVSWNEYKLGSITDVVDSLHTTPKDYVSSGFPMIRVVDVNNIELDLNKCLNVSEETYRQFTKKYQPKVGDVVLSRVGTCGASIMLRTKDNVCLGQNTVLLHPKINKDFYHILVKSNIFQVQVSRRVVGSTQKTLSLKDLKLFKLNIPAKPEQQKIAAFLTAVDTKIEQLSKKQALFSEYKKGLMQQIFSQAIRFKADDTPGQPLLPNGNSPSGSDFPNWEEKRLGDLCEITTGKLDANAMVEGGQYRFYTCAKEYYKIDDYAFDTDALIVSGNGANVGYIHHYQGKFNAYQRTYVLDSFTDNIIFVKFVLDEYLHKRIMKEKNEGNTPYIVMGTLTDMKINLPSFSEQTKIAIFLSSIDSKIEQVGKQLDESKQFKKALLQQMFV